MGQETWVVFCWIWAVLLVEGSDGIREGSICVLWFSSRGLLGHLGGLAWILRECVSLCHAKCSVCQRHTQISSTHVVYNTVCLRILLILSSFSLISFQVSNTQQRKWLIWSLLITLSVKNWGSLISIWKSKCLLAWGTVWVFSLCSAVVMIQCHCNVFTCRWMQHWSSILQTPPQWACGTKLVHREMSVRYCWFYPTS